MGKNDRLNNGIVIWINKIYNNMKENKPIKSNEKNSNHQKAKLYPYNNDKKNIIIGISIFIIVVLIIGIPIIVKFSNSGKESEIIKKLE